MAEPSEAPTTNTPSGPATQNITVPSQYQSPVAPLTLNSAMANNTRPTNGTPSIGPSLATSLHPSPHSASLTSAQGLQPSFQPPAPGQLLVVQATLTMGGYRRSIPALYYTSTNGEHHYAYPFSRTLIGTAWHTLEHLNRCEFQYCHESDPIRFCARRADLPPEMVQRLLISLEQNGGGSTLDTGKLQAWHNDVRNPEGRISAGVPCMLCGIVNEVRLCDVTHLTGISNGMACHHMGKECIREDQPTRISAPVTNHRNTTNTEMVNRASTPPSNNMHLSRISSPPSIVGVPATFSPPSAPWISPPVPHSPPPTPPLTSDNPMHLSIAPAVGQNMPTPPTFRPPDIHPPPFNDHAWKGYSSGAASTPQTWRHVENFNPSSDAGFPIGVNTNSQYQPYQSPDAHNHPPVQPGYQSSFPMMPNTPHGPTSPWTYASPSVNHGMEGGHQPWTNAIPPLNANSNPMATYSNSPSFIPPNARNAQNSFGQRRDFKRDASSVIPFDEIIQPGEELHADPDVQMMGAYHPTHEYTQMPHPSMLVRGRILKSFTAPPPTLEERQEFQLLKEDNRLDKLSLTLSKKLSDRTIPTFKGDTDNIQSYSQWEAALMKHFYSSNINNNAIRAWLAQNSFAEAANVWWVAHQSRRPRLTLSWMQLRELIQTELVPAAEKGSANAAWADLTFDGKVDEYFTKVRAMSLYHPLSPKEVQIMASRPFGSLFVERVRGSTAQQGTRGLTIPQWEAMVKAYVKEQEAHPNFQSWGRGGLEPIHRVAPKLRQTHQLQNEWGVTDKPEVPDDVPMNMDEEEWTLHVATLFSSFAGTSQGGKPLRIGSGPRPCFVCGQSDHSWVKCQKRRRGKCGVCGSENHFTRFCAQRFYPDPKLATTAPMKPSPTPVGRQVLAAVTTSDCNLELRNDTEDVTKSTLDAFGDSVDCANTQSTTPELANKEDDNVTHDKGMTAEETTEWPSIRQVNIAHADDLALPKWLKHRLHDNAPRSKIGKAIVPMENPSETGQLHFATTLDGASAKMLYDPGASHCFMDWEWAHKNGIHIRPRQSTSLKMFQGTALGAIKWSYIANDFVLGEASYAWRFLVIKPAPSDLVLGLDFILHHKPIFDPISLQLWPTTSINQTEDSHALNENRYQEDIESHWVSVCDTIQPRHLNFANTINMSNYTPYARNESHTSLLSVTADSLEEEKQLQDFLNTLDPELREVVNTFDTIFAPPSHEPPNRAVKHHIELIKDALPIKRRPYPLPEHKLKAMKTQITDLHRTGWIEPSISPWGAPILFVPKKNGELRMCVDFRDLNAMTVDDCFPLPRIEVMLHRASQSSIFSKLDLASGFHQIEVALNSRPLTAFRLPEPVDGSALWQWKVMPFGLRNAPPTFQRAMSQALEGLDHCSVVYIDDILIFSKTKDEHLKHLSAVFKALSQHQYHVRLPKCEFFRDEVEFLGHNLTKDGITTQQPKVDALQGWQTPFSTTRQVKSFLGAVAWYQCYIPHFASQAAPLYALTSTRRKIVWTEDCEQAVVSLKHSLTHAPVLARWQQHRDTRVITDASKVGVGAVLEQKHEQGWRPISFWSRKLRKPELNYSATDLEWLAVVIPVTRVWHWLLEGKPFTICSDHKALERKLCKSAHDPPISDRQARWIESLTKFPYHFEWIQGINNTLADALSRNPTPHGNSTVTTVHSMLVGLRKRLRVVAAQDASYAQLVKQAEDPQSDLQVTQGLVSDAQGRICVPQDDEVRTLIIAEAHDSPMAGHFGMDRTLELVQRNWYWKGMQRDVREYVRTCTICQRAKHSTSKPPGELHPIIATRPWEILTLDFVSGLPKDTKTGFSQILVMVDKFTKYVLLEACAADIDAKQTACIFTRRVVCEHGVPAVVISDRGPQFAAKVWTVILKSLGSRTALATTHHPQTDGQSERVIQTLTRVIRAYVRDQSSTWIEMLPLFQFALNNSASATTRLSPFQLMNGRDPISPVNLMIDQPIDVPGGMELQGERRVIAWARNWWKARRKLCKFAEENLRTGARMMKRRYDAGRRTLLLKPGDLVLLSVRSHPSFGPVRKMRLRYTGPYIVKRQVHTNAYELDGLPPSVPNTQNVSHLRLFHPTPPKFESRPEPARAVRPIEFRDHREWEVEAITHDRMVNGQRQYLVTWKDYEEKSWMRVTQLRHCADLLREYQFSKGIALDYWSDSSSSPESLSEKESGREGTPISEGEEVPFNWEDVE